MDGYRLACRLGIWQNLIEDCMLQWEFGNVYKKFWNDELDQIVSLATLMVAIFVWFGEISENWKKTLPKRLTVRFLDDNNQLVLLCIRAKLSDIGDMRNLAQQIGRHMNHNINLEFQAPDIDHSPGAIVYDADIGFIMHYFSTFRLSEIHPLLKEEIGMGKYKEWKAPFRKDNFQIKDRNL